nr:hypothetical protein L203_02246 [Cryptococcus depauperatus CBS 7841]
MNIYIKHAYKLALLL